MSRALPLLMIGILILSGIGAFAGTNNVSIKNYNDDKTTDRSDIMTYSFSPFAIEEYNNDYIEVNLKDVSTYIKNPGDPVLPKVIKTFELPFHACNINVEVTVNNIQEYEISEEIRFASPHIPLIAEEEEIVINSEKNNKVYSSEELYPSSWYDFRIGCGLNDENIRKTHVTVPLYPVRYSPKLNKIYVAESAEIKITYDLTVEKKQSNGKKYDMVIIAPRMFALALGKLVRHKNNVGIKTFLKTTESIYRSYNGVDKPEEIKYFIQDAIKNHNITYVLLVGGLKNQVLANPREHRNYGARWYYVPVRYHNFYDDPEHPLTIAKIHDPGVISDLYYADVFKKNQSSGETEFENWDSNGDGIIGAWNFLPNPNVTDDTLDMYPDVIVGRLACRNILEVRTVVNKIVNYEKESYNKSWFKRMVVISGDGFLDQEDLDFQWDTNGLPDGKYTIIAASRKPKYWDFGQADKIQITLDRTQPTNITFNHDDHLRIKEYPDEPIAEIVSISDGNILGFNDSGLINISEGNAYGNSVTGWANINYSAGILHIRGKTYDPSPYGNITNTRVWILNEAGEIVFDDWRNGSEMYYEGEWITGNETLKGGGGALYYIPDDFEHDIYWASNGRYSSKEDIINALSQGCGFAFLSGHGNPVLWTDHYPGIPGNRIHGSTESFSIYQIQNKFPFLKSIMKQVKNYDKLPIVLIGGCHNSQFNVSLIPTFLDKTNEKNTWCHGLPVPECFSWYLVKMPRTGAIATIGNTGLGYGVLGKDCLTEGLDGGICIEFFKQYGLEYNINGSAILGDVYARTLESYWKTFDMDFLDHAKSLTQWVLLGDPSLMIGGYPPPTSYL